MPRFFLVALFASLALTAHATTSPAPIWGKAVCSAVSQQEATTYAAQNPFIYGNNTSKPPAPAGTLTCTLPLRMTLEHFDDGTPYYDINVDFIGAPKQGGDCTVNYYDGRPARKFAPDGSATGMANADQSDFEVDAAFSNPDGAEDGDDFIADSLTPTSGIAWTPEYNDDQDAQPILANCHVEW